MEQTERLTGQSAISGAGGVLRAHWLSIALIALSWLMIGFIAAGFLGKAKPGTLTWGPTTDMWAISIALDDIKNGELDGLGRREASLAMASILTNTGNDIALGDDPSMVDDPAKVNQAMLAAWRASWTDAPRPPLDSKMVVTTIFEDIGYTDYYNLAFRFFGVNGMSTHYLYVALLVLSAMIFTAGMWRNQAALAFFALASTGLFLLQTSSIFGPLLPDIGANRFLATLAVIPVLQLMFFAFGDGKASRLEIGMLLLQAVLYVLVLNLRIAAIWTLIAFPVAVLGAFAVRYWQQRRREEERGAPVLHTISRVRGFGRMAGTLVLVFALSTGWHAVRNSMLNNVYFGDDVIPKHMTWHSAWIGLAKSPEWLDNLPNERFKDIAVGTDRLAWQVYDDYMAREYPNSLQISPVHAQYKAAMHERIVKEAFMDYIRHHPGVTLRLYLFHKPLMYLELMAALISTIPLLAWLLALPTAALSALAIAKLAPTQMWETLACWVLLFGASTLPAIWAYAVSHSAADQTLMTASTLLVAASFAGAAALRARAKRRKLKQESPTGEPTASTA